MTTRKYSFLVTVKVSDGFDQDENQIVPTASDVAEHVREATECYGGQLHPYHPFFNLRNRVTVKHFHRNGAKK